jgi:hypothetical protein
MNPKLALRMVRKRERMACEEIDRMIDHDMAELVKRINAISPQTGLVGEILH